MYDTNLMLSTDITLITGNGNSIDFGQGGMVRDLVFKVVVPATGTTIDLIIQTSDTDDHSVLKDLYTLPQIDAAGVYRIPVKTKHRYIRYAATVVGDFGKVVIGPEMQGDYDEY